MATKAITKEDLKFHTDRQRQLMRVVLECFENFRKREQHHYLLNGMSTYHATNHAIQDFTTLRAFWPTSLVSHHYGGQGHVPSTIYHLQNDTMSKVNSSVRSCLQQLVDLGYLEKVGNEDERRWRPVKGLKGVTL